MEFFSVGSFYLSGVGGVRQDWDGCGLGEACVDMCPVLAGSEQQCSGVLQEELALVRGTDLSGQAGWLGSICASVSISICTVRP